MVFWRIAYVLEDVSPLQNKLVIRNLTKAEDSGAWLGLRNKAASM